MINDKLGILEEELEVAKFVTLLKAFIVPHPNSLCHCEMHLPLPW